jgi:hypothetical protein
VVTSVNMRSPGHRDEGGGLKYMKSRVVRFGQGRRGMEWLKRGSGIEADRQAHAQQGGVGGAAME